ncbi:MAG: histidine--tRNA ligase [Clostridia bacterium]|nr:histidine--tRNA ligase [Clostridia bacterium]
MIIKPRGTSDILPKNTPVWRKIEQTARDVAGIYGYGEIRFPTFESTELFARGVGDTTDVVQKEMYTFLDKDGRSMTLRPEGTACVVRSVIENGLLGEAMPLKLYYFTSCFRYEKPAAGRYREFYQFGTELFGAETPASDMQTIALADTLLKRLNIKADLKINSIGCKSCRPKYREALVSYFKQYENELCDTCRGRLQTNPMRILDCKSPICGKIAENAPKTIDYLCDDCRSHMESLKALLSDAGIGYWVDPGIVRGLDYYTRTVFEFIAPIDRDAKTGEIKNLTVCAGGRYDGLVEEIGGPRFPGIGFAAGIDRLVAAMKLSGEEAPKDEEPAVYIAPLGNAASKVAQKIVYDLRAKGVYAECDMIGRSLKSQMKYADKIGAAYTVLIGDNEIETGRAALKNMKTSEQTEININEIDEAIAKRGL